MFVFGNFILFSQEKDSDRLKKQQKELEDKIQFNENLLKNTSNTKENLTNNIILINNKIKYREELLNNISLQIKELDRQIMALEIEVKELEKQLNYLENQYKEMIKTAYKMRSSSASLVFILSSENFNQANKRIAYLDQMTKYRADQIRRIKNIKIELENDLQTLQEKKNEQFLLLKNKEVEKQNFVKDKEKQAKTIDVLSGKEKELQDELLAQKKKSDEIKKAINDAINKEIAAEKQKEKEKPKTIAETKEVELNTSGFEANKGRLPWPVSKGEISKGFGKQAHPIHAGVFTYNNGVDIVTVKGAAVRSVYEGEVTSIIVIPGAGKAVIIAHGDYRTIYSNLQEVYVQKGDKISAKQEIGSLMLLADGSVSELHFEIRKITPEGQIQNINPSYWLYK